MSIWTLMKTLKHERGLHEVEIYADPDADLFRYHVTVWKAVDESELLYHPDGGYWSYLELSGFYASLSECEAAARGSLERATASIGKSG